MLIVLEGCDGTGKTTLAKQLATLLNAEIIHCSTKTTNDFEFFANIIEASRQRNIIADRFCYGQFVYQEEKDRPLESLNRASKNRMLYVLETMMLRAGTKVILVKATPEVIRKRLEARGETLINGLTVEEVSQKFETVKNESMLTWLEYSTGGEQ